MFLVRNGKGKPAAGKNERNPGDTDWNLLYDRGDLIRISQIKEKEPLPLRYPAELEQRVKKAVLAEDGEEMKRCYYRVYDLLRRQPHYPKDMKECLIRFNMAVLNAYKRGMK